MGDPGLEPATSSFAEGDLASTCLPPRWAGAQRAEGGANGRTGGASSGGDPPSVPSTIGSTI